MEKQVKDSIALKTWWDAVIIQLKMGKLILHVTLDKDLEECKK